MNQPASDLEPKPARPSTGEVLVVDDTPASLKLLSDLLNAADYTVRLAPNGELALWSVENALPELILLDVRMPGIDGFEVCRRLKSNPATAQVPVIFLSAQYDTEDKLAGFKAGAVDFISKPFAAEEVLARVRTHINLVQLSQQLEHERAWLEQKIRARTEQLETEQRRLLEALSIAQAEAEHLQLQARYFEHTDAAVFIVTVSGMVVALNPAASAFTGYEGDELIGRSMALVDPRWNSGESAAALLSALARDQMFSAEAEFVHKNGSAQTAGQRLLAVCDQEIITHIVQVLTRA